MLFFVCANGRVSPHVRTCVSTLPPARCIPILNDTAYYFSKKKKKKHLTSSVFDELCGNSALSSQYLVCALLKSSAFVFWLLLPPSFYISQYARWHKWNYPHGTHKRCINCFILRLRFHRKHLPSNERIIVHNWFWSYQKPESCNWFSASMLFLVCVINFFLWDVFFCHI